MASSTRNLSPPRGFSRRDFMKGSGAVAAAAAVSHETAAALAQEKGALVVSGPTTIKLDVNGKSQEVKVEPRTTLLEALRIGLDLTGAKPVCTDGSSGAATVLVDGKPMQANTLLAMQAVGKKITTIEGVSPDGSHPIQVAWKEFDTPQCGYCQSGMIMSALALLQRRPNPSNADINAAVTNACRCGSYHRVRQAIHMAADLMMKAGRPK